MLFRIFYFENFDFPNFKFRIFLDQKHEKLGITRYEDLGNTTRSTPARELFGISSGEISSLVSSSASLGTRIWLV